MSGGVARQCEAVALFAHIGDAHPFLSERGGEDIWHEAHFVGGVLRAGIGGGERYFFTTCVENALIFQGGSTECGVIFCQSERVVCDFRGGQSEEGAGQGLGLSVPGDGGTGVGIAGDGQEFAGFNIHEDIVGREGIAVVFGVVRMIGLVKTTIIFHDEVFSCSITIDVGGNAGRNSVCDGEVVGTVVEASKSKVLVVADVFELILSLSRHRASESVERNVFGYAIGDGERAAVVVEELLRVVVAIDVVGFAVLGEVGGGTGFLGGRTKPRGRRCSGSRHGGSRHTCQKAEKSFGKQGECVFHGCVLC